MPRHHPPLLAAGVALTLAAAAARGQTLPAGFADSLVASVGAPTAIAFTPDGRMLVTTQGGTLRVHQGGVLLPTPALTIPSARICANSERGLLGVAVDPDFATNRFVYLFYTFRKWGVCPTGQPTRTDNPVNRVSRFTLPDTNVVDPASEVVLVDNVRSPNGNHNAGDLRFGRDGTLYVTTGDGGADYAGDSGGGGSNDASRDEFQLLGKVLRITRDGGIPPTNPFQGPGTARCNVAGETTPGNRCQETFAWGLRNPFRIALDPNAATTRFFVNDVGQNAWEEVDALAAGADYGWNCREGEHVASSSGPCSPAPPGMVDPVWEYPHGSTVPGTTASGCNSITGGAFVPNGLWPGFDGAYLVADYVCGAIFRLTESGGAWGASDFVKGLGSSSATSLTFGPWGTAQALYYTTYAGGGSVRRITYGVAGNSPPVASASATPRGGSVPLDVTFSAAGSSDPDPGDVLTYFWDFGDGSPAFSTTSPTTPHTYATPGTYTVTLRARDQGFAFSAPVTLTVVPGNQLPVAAIASPAAGATFAVGETVTLTGSGTDAEDGALPPSSLSWTVLLHHDTHTHPFLGPTAGNGLTFPAPAPEDLPAATNSWLEVVLTVTDSAGLTHTVSRDLQPRKVTLTFATVPPGLHVTVSGTSLPGPSAVTAWEGWSLAVDAPPQSGPGGAWYELESWSDGGARAHVVVVPGAPATYTATFREAAVATTGLFTMEPCRLVDTRGADGPLGGPALAAGATRPFVAHGTCGVPATAKALVANVTAVDAAAPGFLTLFPTGRSQPLASTVNFVAGRPRANNVLLLLGTGGSFDVAAGLGAGTVHLVVDVSGWLE